MQLDVTGLPGLEHLTAKVNSKCCLEHALGCWVSIVLPAVEPAGSLDRLMPRSQSRCQGLEGLNRHLLDIAGPVSAGSALKQRAAHRGPGA